MIVSAKEQRVYDVALHVTYWFASMGLMRGAPRVERGMRRTLASGTVQAEMFESRPQRGAATSIMERPPRAVRKLWYPIPFSLTDGGVW